jgi:multidrug efflux pump subunit AcrA (membrane-fusion protein)
MLLTPGAFSVTGTVADAQVGQIALGQRARVLPAGSTEAVSGKVTAISPVATISSGVATFSVTVTPDGSQPALHAGSSASISVIVNQVVHVLTVPTSAVRGGSVQVLVNGAPQTRTVSAGATDPLRTQILSGLSDGEQVVIATVSSSVPSTNSNNAGGLLGPGGGGNLRGGGGTTRGGGGGG